MVSVSGSLLRLIFSLEIMGLLCRYLLALCPYVQSRANKPKQKTCEGNMTILGGANPASGTRLMSQLGCRLLGCPLLIHASRKNFLENYSLEISPTPSSNFCFIYSLLG